MAILSLVITVFGLCASPHPIILVLVYAIHELGHLVFATLVGAKMKKIKLGAFHLSLSYDSSHLSYQREILVCLGGIIFNLASALLAFLLPIKNEGMTFFIIASILLSLMNLYPASILDGAGALKALLYLLVSLPKADKIIGGVSVFAILLIWLISIYLQLVFYSNFSIFIISVILLIELCFSVSEQIQP